jgi:hypothetical protein
MNDNVVSPVPVPHGCRLLLVPGQLLYHRDLPDGGGDESAEYSRVVSFSHMVKREKGMSPYEMMIWAITFTILLAVLST